MYLGSLDWGDFLGEVVNGVPISGPWWGALIFLGTHWNKEYVCTQYIITLVDIFQSCILGTTLVNILQSMSGVLKF